MPNLIEAMAATGCKSLDSVVITHWHHDHTGGIAELLRKWPDLVVRKLLPPIKFEGKDKKSTENPTVMSEKSAYSVAAPSGHLYTPLTDGEEISAEGVCFLF